MRALIIVSIAVAGSALLGACNPYAPAPHAGTAAAYGSRQCFYAPSVRGFRQGPGDSVIVNTNRRDYYQLETAGYCPNLDFRLSIALRTRGGSNFVCDGFDAEILFRDELGLQRCPVRAVRKLGPAEVVSLRGRR